MDATNKKPTRTTRLSNLIQKSKSKAYSNKRNKNEQPEHFLSIFFINCQDLWLTFLFKILSSI